MGTLSENKALRKYGLDLFRDLALLAWANEMHRHRLLPIERKQSWVAMLEQTASWAPPTFPLRGEDVKALGIEPGPQIGRLLARVEDWWESHGYLANRQQCLDQLFKEANR
jgi:poly(A) polymerase